MDPSLAQKIERERVGEIRRLEALMLNARMRRVLLEEERDPDGTFNIFDDPREKPDR